MIKKSHNILGIINFGSFPGKLMFSCGFTFDEVLAELKKQKCNEWMEAFKQTKYLHTPNCAGFSSKQYLEINGTEYEYNFVHLRDRFNFSDYHHTILSHELIHICTHHLSPMLDIAKENEAFAYTHTHLSNQSYKLLREKK